MSYLHQIIFFCQGLLILTSLNSYAQSPARGSLRLVPLTVPTAPEALSTNARLQASSGTVLTLPFWDDFSRVTTDSLGTSTPDTARWLPSSGVLANTGLAIDPPSIGVASFDGINTQGAPYDTDTASTSESALSDELVSCPIDLTQVPEAERGSVYLSFFWQPQGRGEFPEEVSDSLRLQFRVADTVARWQTVWSQDSPDSSVTRVFTQTILPVSDPAFYHDRFQFRFQSYNQRSGAFDTWHVDYVYLDKGRTADDLAYPDAAITSPPTSLFGQHTMVPMKQFRAAPERYTAAPSVGFYNLRNGPVGITFETFVRDALTGEPLIRLSEAANTLSPIPTAFDRRTIVADALDASVLDLTPDSLWLETEFFIETPDRPLVLSITAQGDTIFSPAVDFRVNDTVRSTFILNETMAYDDGSAEFGLDLNQTGGRVAYQFVAPETDLLTHIDINFANFPQNQGALFRLFVWKSLNDTSVLRQTETLAARPAGTASGFTRYQLASPIAVQDTFYIGYQQESDGRFLIVGFDKNTDTSDRLFFSVSQDWEQNLDLNGSLMMRPHFDRERADLVTDLPDETKSPDLTVFPNPSAGTFYVRGDYDQLQVLDLLGREVARATASEPTVDLLGHRPGLYLFRFKVADRMTTQKVVLQY